jgi:hypothetical protein
MFFKPRIAEHEESGDKVVKPAGEVARVIKPSELLEARRLSEKSEGKTEPVAKTTETRHPPAVQNGAKPARADERLEELERTILRSKLAWIVAARSLVEIRDRELYRPHAETMDAYLETRGKERFGVKKRQAHDLMRAEVVAKNCRHVTHELSLSAALVLADLPSEKQAFGLSEAIKLAGHRCPSARQVEQAIAPFALRQKAEGRRQKKEKATPIKYRSAGGVATVVLKPGVDLLALLLEWVAKLQGGEGIRR